MSFLYPMMQCSEKYAVIFHGHTIECVITADDILKYFTTKCFCPPQTLWNGNSRGVGGFKTERPSVVGIWIFSGNTLFARYHFARYHLAKYHLATLNLKLA